jgi:subtilisin family serine protease
MTTIRKLALVTCTVALVATLTVAASGRARLGATTAGELTLATAPPAQPPRRATQRTRGLHAAQAAGAGGVAAAAVPRPESVDELAALRLSVSPAGPSRRVTELPNDPLVRTIDPATGLAYEWEFAAARADRALERSTGDPAVVVGTIDSGADDVPDLAGKLDGLWSVAPNGTLTADPLPGGNDDTGHGTAVASLIAANVDDGFGMAGFGGAAHVIAVHAGTQGFFPDASIARALLKLDSLGVRIVNMSLGKRSPSQPILINAIHKAAADGVLIVAAAGNAHEDVAWPAAALQPSGGGRGYGLAVGATDLDGGLAPFSNSGKHLSLVAPGNYLGSCTGVLVALPPANSFQDVGCSPQWTGAGEARYGYLAGTSFAAPEVAGVAALIWAARPELSNYQVADMIKQSARRDPASGWTPGTGCGLLDAGAALELALSRTAAESRHPATTDAPVCSTEGAEPPAWPSEAEQTIFFAAIGNRRLDDPDFTVHPRASSGLPVSLFASGTCTIAHNTVHSTGVGTCTITASQPGNAVYNPARDVRRTFAITPAGTSTPHARHGGAR